MLHTVIKILWVIQLILVLAACCSAGYEYYQTAKKTMEEYKKDEKED